MTPSALPRQRTVTVVGSGRVRVAPDTANLRVAAVRRAPTAAEAWEGVSGPVDRLVALARARVSAERIASTGVSLWAWQGEQGERGFEARHGLSVDCADLDAASALLGEFVAELGDAIQVEGVNLVVSDQTAAAKAARETAWADARSKAEELAAYAGLVVGEVVSVREGSDGGFVPMAASRSLYSGKGGLQAGESEIDASLTVVFELASQAG